MHASEKRQSHAAVQDARRERSVRGGQLVSEDLQAAGSKSKAAPRSEPDGQLQSKTEVVIGGPQTDGLRMIRTRQVANSKRREVAALQDLAEFWTRVVRSGRFDFLETGRTLAPSWSLAVPGSRPTI